MPACRSLDCVSVFVDGRRRLRRARRDGGRRPATPIRARCRSGERRCAGADTDRRAASCGSSCFGDVRAQGAFDLTLRALGGMGCDPIEIDLTPFLETARLLYEGPWVAERFAAVGAFHRRASEQCHPVTRSIIAAGGHVVGGRRVPRLLSPGGLLRAATRETWARIDVLSRSDCARRLYGGRRQCNWAQFAAQHVHEFRQSARSRRHRGSRRRHAVRRDVSRAGGTGRVVRKLRSRIFHAERGLPLGALRLAQPPLSAQDVVGDGATAGDRDRRWSRARISPACRSTAVDRARRPVPGRRAPAPDYALSARCPTRPRPNPACRGRPRRGDAMKK